MRQRSAKLFFEIITLRTFRGRQILFLSASLIIFLVPYHWLEHLSLWQRLGWESAPSIGLTRAYWLFIHGDPAGAWQRNWLIYLVLFVWLIIFIVDITKIRMKKKQNRLT